MAPVFIFDLGKVLVDFDYTIAARKVAARSAKSPADLHAFLGSSPLLLEYESGQLTRQGFYDAIRAAIGFKGDLAEFGSFFADIFSEMPATIALQAELRLERPRAGKISCWTPLVVQPSAMVQLPTGELVRVERWQAVVV